ELGLALREDGREPDALSAMAIEIRPAAQGGGLSRAMLEGMREVGRRHGLGALLAPVRPSWKERYPLTPIERYARWTREDGLPFDPWIRTHVRLGGEILRPEPQSMRISGTVAEWEDWTETAFPESGEYVFPHGLAPLAVDREHDLGLYFEPNLWMVHGVQKRWADGPPDRHEARRGEPPRAARLPPPRPLRGGGRARRHRGEVASRGPR